MERDFRETIETEIRKDSVLISTGLPGTWKSPVMEEIARLKDMQILRSDMIRLEVLKGKDIFNDRVASDPGNRGRVYEEMLRRAESSLKTERKGLILDATFFTQTLRGLAAEMALRASRPFVIAQCVCSEERSLERILKRTKENYESNALTREAYLNNKAIFEPVNILDLAKRFETLPVLHLTIDTESDRPCDWRIREIEKSGPRQP